MGQLKSPGNRPDNLANRFIWCYHLIHLGQTVPANSCWRALARRKYLKREKLRPLAAGATTSSGQELATMASAGLDPCKGAVCGKRNGLVDGGHWPQQPFLEAVAAELLCWNLLSSAWPARHFYQLPMTPSLISVHCSTSSGQQFLF